MNHFTIRMKHTSFSSFATAAWETNGWTTVYQANDAVISNGWVKFSFEIPFEYNGTNNLMVDFSFNNFYFTTDGLCRSTPTTQVRSLYFQTDSEFGNPLNWSGPSAPAPNVSASVPNLLLVSGFPISISSTNSGPFTNGVWTGSLIVPQPATNLFLVADDGDGHVAFSSIFSVQSSPDTDGDGLPDAWERQYFGSLNAPEGGPEQDPDGDGLTNRQEFLAGTDPRVAASVLRITSVHFSEADVVIRFSTMSGRSYRVERTANLDRDSWTTVADHVVGTGAVVEVSDFGADGQRRQFYRVRLQ